MNGNGSGAIPKLRRPSAGQPPAAAPLAPKAEPGPVAGNTPAAASESRGRAPSNIPLSDRDPAVEASSDKARGQRLPSVGSAASEKDGGLDSNGAPGRRTNSAADARARTPNGSRSRLAADDAGRNPFAAVHTKWVKQQRRASSLGRDEHGGGGYRSSRPGTANRASLGGAGLRAREREQKVLQA